MTPPSTLPVRDAALPPAMVLGVDTPIGLAVVRELGRHGVPVIAVGKSRHAIGRWSRHATRFLVRPDDRPLASWLPEAIARSGAKRLLAISEGDLLTLADLPRDIAGCKILTPRRDRLDLVLDKRRTLALAQGVGIDVPATWQPASGDDFTARAAALAYPVVLKWPDPPAMWDRLRAAGIAFEKTEYAATPDALLRILARYDRLAAWPIVQGYCGGYGFGQMLMRAEGRTLLRFQHRRLREFPARGGVSTLCASVPLADHAGQMAKSEALLAAMGWDGPAMVEYRHDPATGRYWLMEVNGRFWGSLPLASQAGAEFAWTHYARSMGLNVDSASYRPRRARYAIPDAKRLLRILRSPTREAAIGEAAPGRMKELSAFAADYLDPRTGYYVWDRRDPMPLLGDILAIIARRR